MVVAAVEQVLLLTERQHAARVDRVAVEEAVGLPDLATVALKQTAEHLGDHDANPLRAALAARFLAATQKGELASFLVPQMLSDLYLANVLAGMLAWCAYPDIPLETVLGGVTAIFMGGAAANLPLAE